MGEAHKYVKVSVSRTETCDLYVRVPADFEISNLAKLEYRNILHFIADDTTNDLDWNRDDTLNVSSVKNVEAKEAETYIFGDIDDYAAVAADKSL